MTLAGVDIPPDEALRLWEKGRALGAGRRFIPTPLPSYDAAAQFKGTLIQRERDGVPRTPSVVQTLLGDEIIAAMWPDGGEPYCVVIGREVDGKFVPSPELASSGTA